MTIIIVDHGLKTLVKTGPVIIARYRDDYPRSERRRLSIAHPDHAWAPRGSTKRPVNVLLMMFKCIPFNDNATFWQCSGLWLHLRVFFCFVFSSIDMFLSRKHIMQWINAPASREHKLDIQFLTYVISSIWWIKTVGLISIQFTGIDQLHILYTSTKIYANWRSTWCWLLCLKNGTYFCKHRLADKHTQW